MIDADPAGTTAAGSLSDSVARAAQLACILEVTAPKPGNVSPGRPFHDMTVDDFLLSAAAIGPAFRAAGDRPVGCTVLEAVQATRRVTTANTNLGIVLLLAPLVRAACVRGADESLRQSVARVLAGTGQADARDVYAAIRLANPGGLGTASEQDVSDQPTGSLLDVMRLAAHRDDVAREYVTDYDVTFTVGAPVAQALRAEGHGWTDVVVQVFLTLLAARPDTHIARRAGTERARAVSMAAADVIGAGPVASSAWHAAVRRFDDRLRDRRNTENAGTTADLTTSALVVTLLTDPKNVSRRDT